MILRGPFDDWKKVLTRKELLAIIEEYQDFFSVEVMNYLNSLLNLEVSALQEGKISKSTTERLMELKIFKELVIYNLYTILFHLFEQETNHYHLEINGNNMGIEGLNVYAEVKGTKFQIFELDYSSGVPCINLSEAVHSKERKTRELERLYHVWQRLEDTTESYFNSLYWHNNHEKDILNIIHQIEKLDGQVELDESTLFKTQIQQYFNSLVLNKLGVNEEELVEKQLTKSKLKKHLVKEYGYATLNKDITYY